MKRTTLVTFFFAALLGVSAQAQIITNYGQATYGPDANGGTTFGTWSGSWDGSTSPFSATNPTFIAQTFLTPGTTLSTVDLYAYNVQFAITGATGSATFTTAIYAWTPGTAGTGSPTLGNYSTGSVGSVVSGTQDNYVIPNNAVVNPYGTNFADAGGITLTGGTLYALVIQRTDAGAAGPLADVRYGLDAGGDYLDGGLYSSAGGTNFTRSGNANIRDLAFWISFDAASLSPVPEPAVNGAILGGVFVAGLLVWRRYGRKSAAQAATSV